MTGTPSGGFGAGPVRVLLVDDSEADILLVRDAAEFSGAPIGLEVMQDSPTALAHLLAAPAAELPELLLLDLNMPRLNGFEVLERLRDAGTLARLPAVVFTSSTTQADRTRALALGATDFVSKPLEISAVIEFMGHLDRYRRT